MTKIHAYAHREPANCFLPRDVLGALGEPSHVRQGRLYVFATTAEAAWRRLSALDLEPRSVRDLRRAHPGEGPVKALTTAGLAIDGAVYAMPLTGPTVVTIRQEGSDRLIDRVGEIRRGQFIPHQKEPS